MRLRTLHKGLFVALVLLLSGCGGVRSVSNVPLPLPFGGGPQVTPGIPFIILSADSDEGLINIFQSSVPFSVPSAGWAPAAQPVVLTGDYIQLGILRGGAFVFPGPDTQPAPFLPVGIHPRGTNSLGFAQRDNPGDPAAYDTLIPGCSCDGWSVRFDAGGSSYWGGVDANLNSDPGVFNNGAGSASLVSFETYSSGGDMATRSVVDIGPLRVTVVVALRRGDRYASFHITLTNTGAVPITNLRFARSLDFDIDAAAGGSFTTDRWDVLQVGGVNAIVRGRGTVRNLRYYAVATRSPWLAVTDSRTFYDTDPDAFGNNDLNDAAGDNSSTFVFRVPRIDPGQSVTL